MTSPWTALTHLFPDPKALGPSWMFGPGVLGKHKVKDGIGLGAWLVC